MSRRCRAPGNGRFFVSGLPAFVLLPLLFALTACSSADPQLMDLELRVVVRPGPEPEGVEEALVVEADVADADGADELAELVVELQDAGLVWVVPVDRLTLHAQEGQNWYVTPALTVAGSRRIPRGSVRVTARDFSGREARGTEPLPLTLPLLEAGDLPQLEGSLLREPGRMWSRLLIGVRENDRLRMEELVDADPPVSIRGAVSRPGARFWLVAQWSPRLWAETGPWELPED